jgi:hypothetical protein
MMRQELYNNPPRWRRVKYGTRVERGTRRSGHLCLPDIE